MRMIRATGEWVLWNGAVGTVDVNGKPPMYAGIALVLGISL